LCEWSCVSTLKSITGLEEREDANAETVAVDLIRTTTTTNANAEGRPARLDPPVCLVRRAALAQLVPPEVSAAVDRQVRQVRQVRLEAPPQDRLGPRADLGALARLGRLARLVNVTVPASLNEMPSNLLAPWGKLALLLTFQLEASQSLLLDTLILARLL